MNREIYVSTDIETDGPIPGSYSMLSFGSAAFDSSGELLTTFSRNLEKLPGATEHPDTMKWWATVPDAYAATRTHLVKPDDAMAGYVKWLEELPGDPVFVGYPATFDFMFVYWYLITFAGHSPFSFSALDIKTYAMATLKTEFRKTTKKKMPKSWFTKKLKHSHVALEDAIEQGHLFCSILKERNSQ